MNFLSPALLWGLLALVPFTLIYFLKVRPRRKPTNAYFLWEKILQEKSASALFRRLRDVLSLLLMALVVLLIVLAMARPKMTSEDSRDLLLIIDQSPSMAAGTGQEQVLTIAKREAASIVRSLDGSRRLAIVGLADRLNFVSHLSDSPKDLLDAIDSIQSSPVPVSEDALREVNRLAESQKSRVILLTDGHGGLNSLSEQVEITRIEGPTDNAGLVAADLAWIPGRAGVASFFYKVASSFPEERSAELILKEANSNGNDSPNGGRILRVIPLLLKPGISEGQTIEIGEMTSGSWLADLEILDALPADNRVTMGLNEPQKIPVAVQSEQPYFFQRSLQAFARQGAGALQVASSDSAEVILTDGAGEIGEQVIAFNPRGESAWWSQVGEPLEQAIPIIKAKGHPLLRHLEAESINFAGARQLQAPENAVILVESESGTPLIYKARANGRQALIINLDPNEAEFFLSPWFPVLVYDGARNLTGEESILRTVYPVGSQITFPITEEETASWIQPNGKISQANKGELRTSGLHRLRIGGEERSFGVALLQSAESLLDGSGPADSQVNMERGSILAWWLLAAALLMVCTESILYHRRKLG